MASVSEEIIGSQNQDLTKLTNAFMFTEEQITKQLVDMKEQTDFMKKFRCALGIALREIKTLKTTSSFENSKTEGNVTHTSSSVTGGEGEESNLAGTAVASPSSDPVTSAKSGKCVCAEIGRNDLNILKECLSKMTLDDDANPATKRNNQYLRERIKSPQKVTDNFNIIENSIRHIERLKGLVAEKNATVVRLCQQLTQARLIRVKRETKLEQKLKEIAEWKEKFEKAKKFGEKQVKITKGLRVALNVERQRAKSSEKMAHGLEETRRAFESLKAQAGQLMSALYEKDCEIAELTSKLEELEEEKESFCRIRYPVTSSDIAAQIHNPPALSSDNTVGCQTVDLTCTHCEQRQKDLDNLKTKYETLMRHFEDHRGIWSAENTNNERIKAFQPRDGAATFQRLPQNHPYGRISRMHAPYTSPDSYKRVSRPPLRRRLNYDDSDTGQRKTGIPNPEGDNTRTYHHHSVGATVLSPIDENEERVDDVKICGIPAAKAPPIKIGNTVPNNDVTHKVSQDTQIRLSHENSHDVAHKGSRVSHDLLRDFNSTVQQPVLLSHEQESSANHISGPHDYSSPPVREQSRNHQNVSLISSANSREIYHDIDPVTSQSHLKKAVNSNTRESSSTNNSPSRKTANAKTSYLELGTSTSPSPSSSVKSGSGDLDFEGHEQHLCMNSFIRYNEQEDFTDTVSEQSSLPNDDLGERCSPDNHKIELDGTESESAPFGFIWHPALIKPVNNKPEGNPLSTESGVGSSENTCGLLSGSIGVDDVIVEDDVTTHKQKGSQELRWVSYKGHKIDVTDFSIHDFRDIVWTLDDGPDSADNFIKFLASLAKKLNANPKWTGKHSMGNPKDWLSLRGLY